MRNYWCKISASFLLLFIVLSSGMAQGTRILRQPTISSTQIAFTYGGDIWISDLNSSTAVRLTSTPAVESDPHFSPDGKCIAFTSNRSGSNAVYIVPSTGGDAKRLTWHPSSSMARGWTPDGKQVLFASGRYTAPSSYNRLWTISVEGGPASLVSEQWGFSGSYSPDGNSLVLDRMSRWDPEWRAYRGGQNTPLIVLNLKDKSELLLPNESTTDLQPLWLGDKIFFISDRDWTANIWLFSPSTKELEQVTEFTGSDVKWLSGQNKTLTFERDGYLFTLDTESKEVSQLEINVIGDFPWADSKWIDVSRSIRSISLSPSGKRAIMESRGEIFTVPVENGDPRNITGSSGAADRSPIWSPKGDKVAWFSDQGGEGYSLMIANQDGLGEPVSILIGESKLGWEPAWSGDGKYIAFTDDDVRIRIVDVSTKKVKTIDTGGNNLERGSMGLSWSPDSKWLAYAKSAANNFRQIVIWSVEDNTTRTITNNFADSHSPAWDKDRAHLYFLASTDLALGSGWANTSAMTASPSYSVYIVNLRKDDPSPFAPRSDEELSGEKLLEEKKKEDPKNNAEQKKALEKKAVLIEFDRIDRRTVALPMPKRSYRSVLPGQAGTVFVTESAPNSPGLLIHKFSLKDREAKDFVKGASQVSVSQDGNKLLARVNGGWTVMNTSNPESKKLSLKIDLKVKVDRAEEWTQMFEEAWRYEKDYFYDKNMHGRDWDEVYKRYSVLVPYIKHRADLHYLLDQLNGELSVGHSYVRGGDYPEVDRSTSGLLGADFVGVKDYWKIARIYTTENWNPGLSSPLDRPGIKIEEGYFLVGINGTELRSTDNIYQALDGTAGRQTIIHINDKPSFEDSWQEIIQPLSSDNSLRQRAWVEDNRRMVDKLSNGRLAYIWVPNTGTPGLVSFDRYFFAQQDKEGAIIDERFNGGGMLDDYMVDITTRRLRAALTNEVPDGKPLLLPAGILGPKVLLINERAGSGGDFFPWVFRQQNAGPLIGARTWGGLVKASTHYALIDGGSLTAPDNAVFDPINNRWIAENEGVAPDIEVRQDAKALSEGRDPQLERAVKEALLLIEKEGSIKVNPPPFSTPAKKKE